jgi:hypothetical protein
MSETPRLLACKSQPGARASAVRGWTRWARTLSPASPEPPCGCGSSPPLRASGVHHHGGSAETPARRPHLSYAAGTGFRQDPEAARGRSPAAGCPARCGVPSWPNWHDPRAHGCIFTLKNINVCASLASESATAALKLSRKTGKDF